MRLDDLAALLGGDTEVDFPDGLVPQKTHADRVAELKDADYFQELRKVSGIADLYADEIVKGAEEKGISLEESVKSWARFLDREVDDSTTEAPGLADLTQTELYANRLLLDQVIQSLAEKLDCDYLEALDELDRLYDLDTSPGGDEATLGRALESTMTEAELRDAVEIRESSREQVVAELRDGLGPEPEGEITADERVRLPDDADRAKLLTDGYELEKAYLEARDLGVMALDRAEFEAVWREEVQAGYDLVATLQHQQRSAAAKTADVARRTEQYWKKRGRGAGGELAE